MIIGVLQISSTTRNIIPRFKRWSKGKISGYEILMSLLGLGCSSQRGRSITLMSHFSASSHHDEVSILSSGTPSYLRWNKGWAFLENRPLQG